MQVWSVSAGVQPFILAETKENTQLLSYVEKTAQSSTFYNRSLY